jgi:predicted MFS family arabinose efflux permease
MLAGPPYRYGDAVIGLFGVVGAAGALCASVAGRLADAGRTSPATGAFSLIIALSFAVCSLVALVVGVVLLDVGCQGLHVLNHSTIYGLGSGASRLNSAYMTSFFLGGAAGSAASAALYGARGWGAVCLLGATLGLAATLLWASERRERLPGTGAMSRPPAG